MYSRTEKVVLTAILCFGLFLVAAIGFDVCGMKGIANVLLCTGLVIFATGIATGAVAVLRWLWFVA